MPRRLTAIALITLFTPLPVQSAGRSKSPPLREIPEAVVQNGAEVAFRADNGFEINAVPMVAVDERYGHGGITKIESPWGEVLDVVFWSDDDAVKMLLDGEIEVRYTFNDKREPRTISVRDGQQASEAFIEGRREAVMLGRMRLDEVDIEPYVQLASSLAERHSREFLDGLGPIAERLAMPTGCGPSIFACLGAALTWLASTGFLLPACLSPPPINIVTCASTILAHEAAGAAVIGACTAMFDCFDNHGNGCSGQRGPE